MWELIGLKAADIGSMFFYDGHDVHIIDGQMGEILDWSYDYGNVSSWEVLKL